MKDGLVHFRHFVGLSLIGGSTRELVRCTMISTSATLFSGSSSKYFLNVRTKDKIPSVIQHHRDQTNKTVERKMDKR